VSPQADGRAEVELAGGEDAVAPGQACVFYEENGTKVLGGGWIVRTEPACAGQMGRNAADVALAEA
jgi:tRNA-specific 2-thiouridylase